MDIQRLRLRSKFQVRQGTFRGAAIFEVESVKQAEQVGRGNASAVLFAPPVDHAVVDYSLISHLRSTIASLPLMLKVRVGHFAEAEEIQKFGMVDFLDGNEVLGVVDETFIDKHALSIPFVCGCKSLAEGLRRVEEGAQILRMQGKSDRSVQFADTVKIVRSISREISDLAGMNESQVRAHARKIAAPPDLLLETKRQGRVPVLQFAAGGIATTADAALMIRLGCDGVFINSQILNETNAYMKVAKIMDAVQHAWQV
ncbi:pyridoxal 5'-phosphate synthase-like subunit PDX1.2 [Syzygium oleosum]|uniref:pyridoxal 5'-phosphate synthase-like subunit PDX1.2 n=1 Tax=Syzygium oleosum TaxID=219896 RepID=UPI0011D2A72E|nr:pyridoxal 5'-phosphate synthase-like subunit PDX1.2 [Syzygium oleosum]